MATPKRQKLTAHMLSRLEGPGALNDAQHARKPRVYWAGPPRYPDLVGPRYDVIPVEPGRPYLPAFWLVLEQADPSADLLFLEDDVWCVERFVPRVAALEVPTWAGALSLFDFRNEAVAPPAIMELPRGRLFWGSQALLIPARVLPGLVGLIRRGMDYCYPNSWDVWLGCAVEALGLSMALLSPSLVQHLGLSSTVGQEGKRPQAANFPERFPTNLDD